MTTAWNLVSGLPFGWIRGLLATEPTRALSECTWRSRDGAVYVVTMMAHTLMASATTSPAASSLSVSRQEWRHQPAAAPTSTSVPMPAIAVSQAK